MVTHNTFDMLNQVSKRNKYFASDGTAYTQGQVNARITDAKSKKLANFFDEHGYYFCEECGINEHGGQPLDCSHDISVQNCKDEGYVELAWDTSNITIRCRQCHKKHDRL